MILINGIEHDIINFPIGEMNINLQREIEGNTLVTFLYEPNQFYFLTMLLKELRGKCEKLDLFIPYLPYSREDRKIDGHVFTLKHVADSLNSIGLDNVFMLDAHSNASIRLINNSRDMDFAKQLFESSIDMLEFNKKIDYVLFPDAGANNRYWEQFKQYKILTAKKERDENGKIISIEICNCPDLTGAKVVIIDDLCCRGGTFMGVAQKLHENNVKSVHLCVTHTENSIQKGDILTTKLIKSVYTTNSIIGKYETQQEQTNWGKKCNVICIKDAWKNFNKFDYEDMLTAITTEKDTDFKVERKVKIYGNDFSEMIMSGASFVFDKDVVTNNIIAEKHLRQLNNAMSGHAEYLRQIYFPIKQIEGYNEIVCHSAISKMISDVKNRFNAAKRNYTIISTKLIK